MYLNKKKKQNKKKTKRRGRVIRAVVVIIARARGGVRSNGLRVCVYRAGETLKAFETGAVSAGMARCAGATPGRLRRPASRVALLSGGRRLRHYCNNSARSLSLPLFILLYVCLRIIFPPRPLKPLLAPRDSLVGRGELFPRVAGTSSI